MDFEFDKEIDSLLRRAARQETFVSTEVGAHLDADEISAFAENGLPGKARLNAMTHLADCPRCRKILASVMSLRDDPETVPVHAAEPKTIAVLPKIPWYRQLFAFPVVAYTMGGLALVLCGALAFAVLQRPFSNETAVSQNAKMPEKGSAIKGAGSDGESPVEAPAFAANSNSGSAANTAMPMPTPTLMSGSNTSAANTAVQNKSGGLVLPSSVPEADKPAATAGQEDRLKDLSAEQPVVASKTAPINGREIELDKNKKGAPADSKAQTVTVNGQDPNPIINNVQPQQNVFNQGVSPGSNNGRSNTQQRRGNESIGSRDGAKDDRDEVANAAPPPAPKKEPGPVKTEEASKEKGAGGSKVVGGHTFQLVKGIWTDSAYHGGHTTDVKRSSDKYRNLDAAVRNIADTLGGTVIIVAGGTAYKIR